MNRYKIYSYKGHGLPFPFPHALIALYGDRKTSQTGSPQPPATTILRQSAAFQRFLHFFASLLLLLPSTSLGSSCSLHWPPHVRVNYHTHLLLIRVPLSSRDSVVSRLANYAIGIPPPTKADGSILSNATESGRHPFYLPFSQTLSSFPA